MYRMLIVDDEPIIVEGLYDLFQQADEMTLELYQAYDGIEAWEIAQDVRIDILLTDYHMPEMSGLELQNKVMARWPRCKVILLTGYDDFQYIQSTLRSGAIDYVLKTEGDESIMAAVAKAIKYIDEEVNYDRLIHNAKSNMEQVLPSLRKDYLTRLILGDVEDLQARQKKFEEFQIPMDASAPVAIILGRVDHWRQDMAEGDKSLFMYAIHNIVEEYLTPMFRMTHFSGEHDRMVWLLQPDNDEQQIKAKLLGMLESVQEASRKYLRLTSSFVISSELVAWDDITSKFDRLSIMFERGLGLGAETLLSDERIFADVRQHLSSCIRRIRLLDSYLSQKDEEKFFSHFREIMKVMEDEQLMQTGVSLEVFYELAAIFIAHINRLELFVPLSEKINISQLLSIREHKSWSDISNFFEELAHEIFNSTTEESNQEMNEIVYTIRDYINANLDDDLSLIRLADLVHFTPFYVSRLYKQNTGQSISDYIAEQRIAKAKSLLSETQLKVHEVGLQVGYDSPAYFTRFFKKMTTLTPQQYRESLKRI